MATIKTKFDLINDYNIIVKLCNRTCNPKKEKQFRKDLQQLKKIIHSLN